MDRDRDRDRRPLDIPPEDQYGTGRGQSYRPGAARERASPARADSYRARSPPRRNEYGDSYRTGRPRSRTPPRKEEYRRRSPSPRFRDRDVRGGGDSYRGRPRSPPRREDLPRGDLFRKEPARETRDFREERGYRDDREHRDDRDYSRDERDRTFSARSPPARQRERSPLPLKRGRETSPFENRDRRSPPQVKRERLDSPPRGRYGDYPPARVASPPRQRFSPESRERRQSPKREFRQRSRSPPPRNERADPRDADDWRRPRSQSPQRHLRPRDYNSTEESGDRSVNTSRRSSPPMHPSRLQQVDDRSGRPTPREPYDTRDSYQARSPEPKRVPSPPNRERDYSEDLGYGSADDRVPPPRDPYRSDDQPTPRAPPTGPSGFRAPSASAGPPAGPSSAPVSISAHSRAPAVPPSGPRSAGGPSRGDFGTPRGRGGYRGDFGVRGGFTSPSFRGGRGGAAPGSSYGRGGYPSGLGRSESYDREPEFNGTPTGPSPVGNAPPSGPRNSFSQAPPPPPFRPSSNTTATTYPRTQRFGPNGQPIPEPSSSATPSGPRSSRRPTEASIDRGPHPALADLPKPVEGGQKLESLVDRSKLDKLEEDAERLRRIIDEKEAKKRKAVREWDRLSRETEAAAYRSQIAEEALRKGSGDVYSEGAGAAF